MAGKCNGTTSLSLMFSVFIAGAEGYINISLFTS